MNRNYIVRTAAPGEFGEIAEFCAGKGRDRRSREIVRRRREWLRDMSVAGLTVVVAVDGTPPPFIKWEGSRVAREELTMLHDGLAVGLLEYVPIGETLYPVAGEGYLYLNCLWVIPPYRRRGVGAALMAYVIREAKANGLGVATLAWRGTSPFPGWDYMPAEFFRRFGFEEVERHDESALMAVRYGPKSPPALIRGEAVAEEGYVFFCHPSCPASMTGADEIAAAAGETPVAVREMSREESRRRGTLFGLGCNGRIVFRRLTFGRDFMSIQEKGGGDSSS